MRELGIEFLELKVDNNDIQLILKKEFLEELCLE